MQSFLPTITGCLLALVLAACTAVGPDYQPPASEMPANWSVSLSQTTTATETARWWGLFQDPMLDALVARAITANTDLRIAQSRIKSARAKYLLTTAAADPSLNAGADYTHARRSENGGSSSGSQDLYQAGFDANWEIDFFGGQRRAAEAAAANLEASEENRRDVLISLEAEVARTYFELRGTERRLATAKNNLIAQEKTLETVQGRLQLGLASRLEESQSQTQKALLAAALPALEQKITLSRNGLALLLNLPPAELAPLVAGAQPAYSLPPSLPTGTPSDLLRRRPDIRRAERQLAAATAEIGVATADLFPRFSLSALAGLQSASLGDLIASSSRYWSVGPSFSLPLFNRDRLQAAVTISEATHEEMAASYEQTVLVSLVETENTLGQFTRAQETRKQLNEAVAAGQQAVTFNEGLFRSGLADLTDVLATQRTLYQAEDQFIQNEQQLFQTAIALYKALGGGWEISGQQPNPHINQEQKGRK